MQKRAYKIQWSKQIYKVIKKVYNRYKLEGLTKLYPNHQLLKVNKDKLIRTKKNNVNVQKEIQKAKNKKKIDALLKSMNTSREKIQRETSSLTSERVQPVQQPGQPRRNIRQRKKYNPNEAMQKAKEKENKYYSRK